MNYNKRSLVVALLAALASHSAMANNCAKTPTKSQPLVEIVPVAPEGSASGGILVDLRAKAPRRAAKKSMRVARGQMRILQYILTNNSGRIIRLREGSSKYGIKFIDRPVRGGLSSLDVDGFDLQDDVTLLNKGAVKRRGKTLEKAKAEVEIPSLDAEPRIKPGLDGDIQPGEKRIFTLLIDGDKIPHAGIPAFSPTLQLVDSGMLVNVASPDRIDIIPTDTIAPYAWTYVLNHTPGLDRTLSICNDQYFSSADALLTAEQPEVCYPLADGEVKGLNAAHVSFQLFAPYKLALITSSSAEKSRLWQCFVDPAEFFTGEDSQEQPEAGLPTKLSRLKNKAAGKIRKRRCMDLLPDSNDKPAVRRKLAAIQPIKGTVVHPSLSWVYLFGRGPVLACPIQYNMPPTLVREDLETPTTLEGSTFRQSAKRKKEVSVIGDDTDYAYQMSPLFKFRQCFFAGSIGEDIGSMAFVDSETLYVARYEITAAEKQWATEKGEPLAAIKRYAVDPSGHIGRCLRGVGNFDWPAAIYGQLAVNTQGGWRTAYIGAYHEDATPNNVIIRCNDQGCQSETDATLVNMLSTSTKPANLSFSADGKSVTVNTVQEATTNPYSLRCRVHDDGALVNCGATGSGVFIEIENIEQTQSVPDYEYIDKLSISPSRYNK